MTKTKTVGKTKSLKEDKKKNNAQANHKTVSKKEELLQKLIDSIKNSNAVDDRDIFSLHTDKEIFSQYTDNELKHICNMRDKESKTALDHAIEATNHYWIKKILEATLNTKEQVSALLEKKMDEDVKEVILDTALVKLVSLDKLSLQDIKSYIEQGAKVDAQDSSGVTALIDVASNGKTKIYDYLLQKGANILHRDSDGNSIMHYIEDNEVKFQEQIRKAYYEKAEYDSIYSDIKKGYDENDSFDSSNIIQNVSKYSSRVVFFDLLTMTNQLNNKAAKMLMKNIHKTGNLLDNVNYDGVVSFLNKMREDKSGSRSKQEFENLILTQAIRENKIELMHQLIEYGLKINDDVINAIKQNTKTNFQLPIAVLQYKVLKKLMPQNMYIDRVKEKIMHLNESDHEGKKDLIRLFSSNSFTQEIYKQLHKSIVDKGDKDLLQLIEKKMDGTQLIKNQDLHKEIENDLPLETNTKQIREHAAQEITNANESKT